MNNKRNIIKILIVDDHYMIAKLLKMMLVTVDDMAIVGIAKNSNELDQYLGKKEIDIILLDIDMPQINGLQILKKVKQKYPSINVIMLTNHIEVLVIKKAINLGANGYISKFSDSDEILDAIRKVNLGETHICKTCLNKLVDNIRESPKSEKYYLDKLSKREWDVLILMTENLTSKEIAEKLFISLRTVETHRKNILKKTEAKNSLSLIKTVLASDLIDLIKV